MSSINKTPILNLPQYQGTDTFDLSEINESYNKIDTTYKEIIDFREEIPKVNPSAELIDARGGLPTLGEKVRKISSDLEHKASKAEVDVERKRIDSFTTLSQGSTTGDAELIDGRIANDGIVYSNIGKSIRNQIAETQKDMILNKTIPKENLISNSFINYVTGNVSTLSGLYASDFIDIKGFNKVLLKNVTTNSSKDSKGLAFYDINNKFISGMQYEANQTVFELDIPLNASFIRFTTTSNSSNIIIQLSLNLKDNINFLNTIKNNELLKNQKTLHSNDFSLTNDKYIHVTGSIGNATGYKYTAPLQFYKGEVITISCSGYDNIAIISTSNIDGTNLKCVVKSESTSIVKYNYIVEEDCYLVFSFKTLEYVSVINKDNVVVKMNNANIDKISNISNSISNEMLRVFSKTICIGDSLTRGYNAEYDSAERNRDYSYPYVLEKKYGTIFDNYGNSGTTPKWWWERYSAYDFSSYQCALICLGTNGKLATDEDITYLTNIINKLKNDSPHIKIFMLSLPPSSISDASVVNSKIQAFAQTNSLPYIDIYNNSLCASADYRSADGVHFRTLGYMLLALEIERKVNEYIYTHQEEFMNVWYPKTWDNILH